MASPIIENAITTAGYTATSSPILNLPGGIVAGETLLAFIRFAETSAIGWPAGWTELFDDQSDTSDDSTALAWRKATGAEGGSITLSCSVAGRFAGLAWRISGATDPTVTPPEFSPIAVGANINPNPNSITPAGGPKDFLFIAIAAWVSQAAISDYPPSYILSPLLVDGGALGSDRCGAGSAGRRVLCVRNEDVEPFTIGISTIWTAVTVAVHPSAAGECGTAVSEKYLRRYPHIRA